MKKILTLTISFFSLQTYSFGQRISDHNTIGWFTTTVTPKISEKWSGHFEYQWRRTHVVQNWQQSLLRVGATYKISNDVAAQVGYGWARTFDYGEYFLSAVNKTFDEHRIYEQIVLNNRFGKLKYSTRFRLEQRWLAVYSSVEDQKPQRWNYLNRFRLMPRFDLPIGNKGWYAAAYDEVMLGFGGNIGQNVFDQNRVGLLAGYTFSPTFRLEGGYLNQTVQFGRQVDKQNVFQYNNGVVVNTYVSF
ncbi:MAG: DUF2490 domain-containing protein [Chitinophagaceae bacterium]